MTKLVLIVDDDNKSRKLCRDILEIHGYATRSAANGKDALAAVAQAHPDVILMDMRMPEMDGAETIRILRNDALTRHIPIIVLTASISTTEPTPSGSIPYDAFITKPVHVLDLVAVVNRVAGQMDTPSDSPQGP